MADDSGGGLGSLFSGLNFGKIGSIGSNIGGAVGDIFAAEGDKAEAQNYELAAQLARSNAFFSEKMTKIREVQQQREVSQVLGAQQAAYAGGNIAESGSAMDVMRSSAQQGALQYGVLAEQGAMQEASYNEQAQAYETMASAARKSAEGSDIAAGIKGVTALAGLFL